MKKIASTEKTNFKVRYYILYCYNDGAFSDTKMGVYKLTALKL